MASPTVQRDPRADALVPRIAALAQDPAPDPARLEALALGLVDGVLAADGETLQAALEALRDARSRAVGAPARHLAGWLDGAIAFVHWALERLTPEGTLVADGTQASEFLRALEGAPELGSAELRQLLETDETQVSRTARHLLDSGLVTRRKQGKRVFWQLSPRGRSALEAAATSAPTRSGDASVWNEALKRGFDAAHGAEPAAETDPARSHIVDATLYLHTHQGIAATTWEDIAARAGVPLATVEELFPTRDDMIRTCGQHVFSRLALPPPERAPEIFEGLRSEPERVRRLVDTLFAAYDRAGEAIDGARRERADLPVLDEAMGELDASIDALVGEALRARKRDPTAVASVRALTDLAVWRALRDGGAAPEAVAGETSAAVERWLETNPARPPS